jgi:lysyl-tRNA synthetase class II
MLEAYCAFGDYATMMETVESLITTVAQKVLGTLKIQNDKTSTVAALLESAIRKVENLRAGAIVGLVDADKKHAIDKFNFKQIIERFSELRERIGKDDSHKIAHDAGNWMVISGAFVGIARGEAQNLELAQDGKDNQQVQQITKDVFTQLTPIINELRLLSQPKVIDLATPWRRVKYKDLVREKTGADWFTISAADRRQRAHDMGAEIGKEFEDFEVTNAVFSKFIEPTLIQPTFVTHLPKELVPLAKLSPDDPTTVEVFECCINGQEISPGYTEQNDPIAQRATLEHQAGGEQQKLDEDFLVALEHGMPPAGGIGIGIDRLCMMLLGQESIRDVILFPQLKPK